MRHRRETASTPQHRNQQQQQGQRYTDTTNKDTTSRITSEVVSNGIISSHILVMDIGRMEFVLVQEVAGLSPRSLRLLATPVSVTLTEVRCLLYNGSKMTEKQQRQLHQQQNTAASHHVSHHHQQGRHNRKDVIYIIFLYLDHTQTQCSSRPLQRLYYTPPQHSLHK